jgi:hypothetical protein
MLIYCCQTDYVAIQKEINKVIINFIIKILQTDVIGIASHQQLIKILETPVSCNELVLI